MAKSLTQLQDEIAKLNHEIANLKLRTQLETSKAQARRLRGGAAIALAQAKHESRKSRFSEIRNRLMARGLPLTSAVRRAKHEAEKF